jgi:hypothetical protein
LVRPESVYDVVATLVIDEKPEPLVVDRYTLYDVAPLTAVQDRLTLVLPGVALSPVGAEGGDAVETVRLRDAVPVPAALVALKLTVDVPVAVGVPEMMPVDVSTLRPAGKPVAL